MSRSRGWRKPFSHWLKARLYACEAVDDRLDRWLLDDEGGAPRRPLGEWLLRLLPERRLRESPFAPHGGAPPGSAGRVRILSLIPPEDTGGGSRPAQLAGELHRRGFAIEWLWVLPVFPWPRRRRPAVPGVSARRLGEPAESGALEHAEVDLVLLEAPHPELCRAARELPRRGPLVYEAIDVWDGPLGEGWYDRAAEEWALSAADHLSASSSLLEAETAARSRRPVELSPNAVDLERFRSPGPPPGDVRRGAPTVVYVGALWGEWIDVALLDRLAQSLPEASIHLIGPPGSRRLPERRNLHVLGPRPRSRIPAYLAAADVTIVPFTPGRLAAAVSPLKLFEYLALERPVVATALPELEGVPGVTVARSAGEFVDAVREATSRPFPSRDVRSFLEHHTWAARVDRLLEVTRLVRR